MESIKHPTDKWEFFKFPDLDPFPMHTGDDTYAVPSLDLINAILARELPKDEQKMNGIRKGIETLRRNAPQSVLACCDATFLQSKQEADDSFQRLGAL